MENPQIRVLLNKYLEGTATEEERAFVEHWYLEFKETGYPEITEAFIEQSTDRIWKKLEEPEDRRTVSLARRIGTWTVAAVIALIISGGFFYYDHNRTPKLQTGLAHQADIAPGTNKAILTLANGKKISLTDVRNGALTEQGGSRISKTAEGELVYEAEIAPNKSENKELSYNTIETPRGGQYQVLLPDGTRVWLNAASSLSYPVSFAGQKDRKVELAGEAYFEVARDQSHPFKVKSQGQEIEVLGTHFNVNAYADEPEIKTALLEGQVKVTAGTSARVIKPGEQASTKASRINVEEVNVNAIADWKNGKFRFKNEPLVSILRKVSRWYDVKISYDPDLKNIPTFSGSVSRLDNVSAVLKMLEETSDVKFSIEGKTIIVK